MVDDEDYFLARAEEQFGLARAAGHEDAARAHYEIAGHYWDRAFNPTNSIAGSAGRLATAAILGTLIALALPPAG